MNNNLDFGENTKYNISIQLVSSNLVLKGEAYAC